MKTTVKVAVVGASGYSGEELVRLLLNHPHAELTAVTSRQYAGQTIAQAFRKFAHLPRARTLRFSEPNAELLAKQAEAVFLALPHGVAAEYALPLLQLRARPSRARLAQEIGLRPPGNLSRATQERAARRVARLLSDEHFAADDSLAARGLDPADRHHR